MSRSRSNRSISLTEKKTISARFFRIFSLVFIKGDFTNCMMSSVALEERCVKSKKITPGDVILMSSAPTLKPLTDEVINTVHFVTMQ